MIQILSVIGTRPEAIKMAPVILEMKQESSYIRSFTCVTGQHRDMVKPVLELFEIREDFTLDVMEENQTLSRLTASLFAAIDEVIEATQPDWVVAQGDTTTVLVASLCAYYRRVRFAHVEAGLRTGNKHQPFPEEVNRRVADVVADLHFVPTPKGKEALLSEGIPESAIYITGNTVIDALLNIAKRPFNWEESPLSVLSPNWKTVLVTAHRRESFGEPFRRLCQAIRTLAQRFFDQGIHFVYPVHLNPNVRKPVEEILKGIPNVHLLEPIDYRCLVQLMKRSMLILTDSGGIQEEAPTFEVPVLVMRNTTERPEGIDVGVVKLVGTEQDRIVAEASRLLQDSKAREAMTTETNPYGDGKSASRIVQVLLAET